MLFIRLFCFLCGRHGFERTVGGNTFEQSRGGMNEEDEEGVPCGRTRTHAHLDKNGLREPRKRDGLSAEVLICTMDTYDKVRKPTVEL